MNSEKEMREYFRKVSQETADMNVARDALVQKENHAKLVASFNEVDNDGSGLVSLAELTRLLGKTFPDYPEFVREAWAQVIMRTCDTNNDGHISLREYLSSKYKDLLYEGGQLDRSEWNTRLTTAFKEIDTDGSNLIDAYELVELLNKIFPNETEETRKKYYKKILEDCDKNNDGLIALDEFLKCNFAHALVVRERTPKRSQFLVRSGPVGGPLSAASPSKRRGGAMTPTQMMGTKADRREAVTGNPAETGASVATFVSSASSKSNIDRVIDDLKFTMEDYTKWDRPQVQKFVRKLSEGCSLLQKDLEKNLYALNEIDGSQLVGMNKEDLETLGITYKCVHLFVDALNRLEQNERTNTMKRTKAAKLKAAFLAADEDNSGYIEKDEIKSVVLKTFPETSSAMILVYFTVLLQNCDPHGTGNIDLKALMESDHEYIMMKVMAEAEKAEVVEEAFRALDEDGSGVLERPELETLINVSFPDAGPTVRRKYYNIILDLVDADKSGTVTLEEIFQSDLVKLMTELPVVKSDGEPEVQVKWRSVNARCIPTSPRRKEPVSRSYTVAHHQRNEADNFLPQTGNAQSLVDKAEQLLELDPTAHWGDAQEYFEDASKIFRHQGEWYKAGHSMERASDCYEKLNRKLESAAALRDAAMCYKETSHLDAAQCFKEAGEIFMDVGKPRMAAKEYRNIAEVYENEEDFENAIDWYQTAADTYPKEDRQAVCQCTQKVAILLSHIALLDESYVKLGEVIAQCKEDQAARKNTIPKDVERLFQFAFFVMDLVLLNTKSGIERLKGVQRAQTNLNKFLEIEDTPKDANFAKQIYECVQKDRPLTELQHAIDVYSLERVLDDFIQFLLSLLRENIVDWHRSNDARCIEQIKLADQRTLVLTG
eukprot:TRINITY_DN61111_c0_g1_i1.p1 TRINITY_DN61111_c0_g1~~TRINITY_DN61111_c0_g1_i1.p1  ORF type:complete len:886 (-),score=118.39 TRINITY_DN61111_c0_g1_i1:1086-3743(-)